MNRWRPVPSLSVDLHVRHSTHDETCHWVERNCYVDVFIEMLHALGLEPLAVLGSCVAIDFEDDNFTFFKPDHEDLRTFFSVDVQELNVWLPLLDHVRCHLAAGRLISTEADSFWLPDVSGTDYRRNHVKSTIVIAELDETAGRLGYFHNAGFFELDGEDYANIFRLGSTPDPTFLPLFAELVRIDRLVKRPLAELTDLAMARLAVNLSRRPGSNPVRRFQACFARDLPSMQELGLTRYHKWAFATTRQLGVSAELLSMHLSWLCASGGPQALHEAADAFLRLSACAKVFILKAARTVNTRKHLDSAPLFDEMASAWEIGMQILDNQIGGAAGASG